MADEEKSGTACGGGPAINSYSYCALLSSLFYRSVDVIDWNVPESRSMFLSCVEWIVVFVIIFSIGAGEMESEDGDDPTCLTRRYRYQKDIRRFVRSYPG